MCETYDKMIDFAKEIANEHQIGKDRFEFQMLYGMRSKTQLELVKEGYNMRVYLPYGDDWYGYFMRRLKLIPVKPLSSVCTSLSIPSIFDFVLSDSVMPSPS